MSPWQRRTNVWRRITSRARGAKRLRSGTLRTARPQHRQEGQARALPMERMTEHDMIGWFNAAPMGSRQQRMLWAAHKIARLTGAGEPCPKNALCEYLNNRCKQEAFRLNAMLQSGKGRILLRAVLPTCPGL